MPEQTNFQNDNSANSNYHDNNNTVIINRIQNRIMFLNNDNEAEFLYDLQLPNILLHNGNYFPVIIDFQNPPNHLGQH